MSFSLLRVQHTSLQFSDPRRQQEHDVRTLFAKGKNFPIKTGTESGRETDFHFFLERYADEFGHVIHFSRGNWVAIDRDIIRKGSVKKGEVFVLKNDHLHGKMHDRTFPTIRFTHVDRGIGRVGVGAFHYATKGQTKKAPNWDANKIYADKIAKWMANAGRRSALALGAGDFNMLDHLKSQDWAFGNNFTSMADELNAHKNTGHGPIDGFVSYDKDKRVEAKRFEVLRDNELHMYSDHYVCRGVWVVKHRKV